MLSHTRHRDRSSAYTPEEQQSKNLKSSPYLSERKSFWTLANARIRRLSSGSRVPQVLMLVDCRTRKAKRTKRMRYGEKPLMAYAKSICLSPGW